MKKVLLSAAVVLASVAVMGQSLVSKKGEPILPQALDYALGFDAVPLFNSLKFNDANATIATASPIAPLTFFGKRFDSENSACRYTLMLGANTNKTTTLVNELDAGVATGDLVEDESTTRNFDIMLGFGREFRRGNTRIQGYWGLEGLVGLNTGRTKVEYGNDRDDLADGNYFTEQIDGTTFSVAARGFMGAEYFFAPKFSIGLEYGITAMLQTQGYGETTSFDVNAGDASSEDTVDSGNKNTGFGVNTGVANGRVVVLMHF